MFENERLTGKTRHRTSWLGKQILQVEVAGETYSCDGGGSYSPAFYKWRDARSYETKLFEVKA